MCQLLGLVLDLFVQALQYRQDGALNALLGLGIGVDEGLGIRAHVLEKSGNATEALIKVIALFQRLGYSLPFESATVKSARGMTWLASYLQNLLILFGLILVDPLHCSHVLLHVADRMFPRLQPFGEEAGGLNVGSAVSWTCLCTLVGSNNLHW